MTTTKLLRLRGAGGKKPKSPTYTNDNLFSEDSIELLLGVGEGPIQGLENGAKSFFVGDVPLERVEGASTIKNFANLIINPNALNDKGQGVDYHNGFPEGIAHDVVFQKGGTSASVEVGTQVLYSTPVIRYTPSNMRGRIKKLEVRVNIAQLGIEDSNGTRNNTAKFRIEYKTSDPNSLWTILDAAYSFPLLPAAKSLAVVSSSRDGANEYQLEGKTGSGFIIDFAIPANPLAILPPQFEQDWMIRVTKNSPDYLDGGSGNATKEIAEIIFDSFQMIGDARRDFPNTAVIHVLGTASDQFSSLPDFYGIYKGLMTPVPVGYNTEANNPHQFVTWTGALENKYHSNPAWVLYDLLNNERYGYRKYVSDLSLNRQDFYEAGLWCDSQVVGKSGSPERRYTMNITIAENQNAWEYLQNIAGAFDGILYDDGEGTVRLKVDKWVEPKIIFTPETINAEGFAYSFTDVATQYNELTVSYVNPARGWEESRTVVSYGKSDASIDNGQAVNGVIPLDFVAVGCITESEAIRRGRARALTASTENTLINFTTTRLGVALDPLEIFYVADPYMDWGQTGRAEVISGRNIYLRDGLPWTVTDYSILYHMYIQTLSDVIECEVLLLTSTQIVVISNTAAFDTAVFAEFPVFVLSGGRMGYGKPKPFRATTLEPTNNYNLFNISGLEVNPAKFDIIGDAVNVIAPSITTDILDGLNLRKYFTDKYIAPLSQYSSVTIVIDGTQQAITGDFLLITAADVNSFALTVGDWSDILPVGVKPKLVVKGNVKILGRGGKGGDGGALMAINPLNTFHGLAFMPPEYGLPIGSPSVMGGLSGQNGGPSANFENLLDLEIQDQAVLEISGGYGGGYGGDGCYVAVPNYAIVVPSISNADTTIFRLCGAGGSGGRPFGAAGAAGATNRGVSSGTVGLKGTGGVCPDRQVHPVVQTGLVVRDGEGHDGLPAPLENNTPVPEFVTNPTDGYTHLVTYAGSRVNGSQGVAITNYGNVNITGSGQLITTP